MDRISVRCPECGHRMDIDPKVIAFRCSQCGKKIDLDEEPVRDEGLKWPEFNKYNTAHTNRTVDDAEVIKARTEYEKQKHANESDLFAKDPFKALLFIALFGLLMLIFGKLEIWFSSSML